jgi:uncharacterized membrane protein
MTSPRPASATSDPTPTADLERSIARLLTVGTYVSIALLLVGLVLMLANGINPRSGGPAFAPPKLIADLVAFRPAGVVFLGLIAVIATPAARVLASLIGYARRGERTMTIVAALILVVIAFGVVLGLGLEG